MESLIHAPLLVKLVPLLIGAALICYALGNWAGRHAANRATCDKCRHRNPRPARYCGRCGNPLRHPRG